MIGVPTPLAIRDAFRRVPTADLYVHNPLRRLRRDEPDLPPIQILAPNLYRIGAIGVIVRYGAGSDVDRLRREGAQRIVYVADDDFSAAAVDPHLPAHYRERLKVFAEGDWRVLKEGADIVIVPGAVLAEQYGAKATVIAPAWHKPPASLEHFSNLRHIDIAHLGTGSHRADLDALAKVFSDILRKHREARLTLFSVTLPEALRNNAQVRLRRPMAWWRYRLTLPRMRFHLALYPLRDTPFNRARSANKFFEHALAGAASLMSPNPALVKAAGSADADIFVPSDPEEWRRRVENDLDDRDALRRRAETTRTHIITSNPLDRAAKVWREVLST
jgi:hypothetical protein